MLFGGRSLARFKLPPAWALYPLSPVSFLFSPPLPQGRKQAGEGNDCPKVSSSKISEQILRLNPARFPVPRCLAALSLCRALGFCSPLASLAGASSVGDPGLSWGLGRDPQPRKPVTEGFLCSGPQHLQSIPAPLAPPPRTGWPPGEPSDVFSTSVASLPPDSDGGHWQGSWHFHFAGDGWPSCGSPRPPRSPSLPGPSRWSCWQSAGWPSVASKWPPPQ